MRFLVDECLSPEVARRLNHSGHDAVHAVDLGLVGAEDIRLMRAAADDNRVLVSEDTDFGELLAVGRHPGPSVVILRRAPHRATAQAQLILSNLPQIEGALLSGAVVVLSGEPD